MSASSAAKPNYHRPGLVHELGKLLYYVGFQTEYMLIRLVRMLRGALALLWLLLRWIGKTLHTHFKPFFITVGQELLSPWVQAKTGFNNLRTYVRAEREMGHQHAAKEGMAYVMRGVQTYKGLLQRGLSYLLPVGAAVVFVFTVANVLSDNYALEVLYRGEHLAYIANENIYEDAQSWVQGRIRNKSGTEKWDVRPTFEVVSVSKAALSNKADLANSRMAATGEEITQATGILVDGTLVGVTADSKTVQAALDAAKEPYLDAARPNLRAEFLQNVEPVAGLYFTDTLIPAQQLVDRLTGNEPVKLDDGTEVAANFLRVKQVERVTFEQETAFEQVRVDDTSLSWGEKQIVQAGQNGRQSVTQDVTYLDGEEVSRTTLKTETIAESVAEVTHYGVLSDYGVAGDIGDGNLIWPVPGYRSVSRGMAYGHRGLDITGKKGTPIYASDNGVIEFSGNGAGTYNWSYGNFVKIDHGNGMTTLYGHMSQVACETGQYVRKGDLIGYIGSTGVSTGNHLHFEVTVNGRLTNPYKFVKKP